MELSNLSIKNFRSIKDEEIIFDHNCLILLGKNEAGKSNVLKAIAAVFGEYIVKDRDKRKRIDTEKIEEYYVRATLKLKKNEVLNLVNKLQKKFTNSNKIIFKSKRTLFEFAEFYFSEILIQINISNEQKPFFSRWGLENTDFELEQPLFLIGNDIVLVSTNNTLFDIENEIFLLAQELYKSNPIKCHYWQYNDNFLLPNKVSITKFLSDPSSVKGLENIFTLCKRENIKQEFEDTLSQDGDYSNLLDQVSKSVSSTFQKIWKDFKDTAIQLSSDGGEIVIKVVNKTKYSFEDRSDGFKKFISILLMLSTQSRSNKIHEMDLILIDEPDQSLYPTSARYLRDELFNISKNSKVVYSTHSQYMIDSSCIDRHLIVEKKEDITTIKKEDRNASFSNDELLRQAIGSSIFECLQPINIIFEGWLDKELFIKYCDFVKCKKDFDNHGIVYLGGISGVDSLVQLLILAKKKFLIISDSDSPSNNKRDIFKKTYPEYIDSWLSYADVTNTISTMEDYFSIEHLKNVLNEYKHFEYNINLNAIENISIATKKDKELIQSIKNKLIQKIKKENIENDYYDFLNKMKEKLSHIDKT
jgi:AAA15 family ATPase/GTPase